MAVYKRVAKIGSIDEENEDVLEAIVENLTVLMGASGFLEVPRIYPCDFLTAILT